MSESASQPHGPRTASAPERRFDAVVLAGGAGRRLGGTNKPMIEVGGAPMLARVLDAVTAARVRVVVGPTRPIRDVLWCQESPPGSGPVAALAAALPLTSAPALVVLAADLPGIAPAIRPLLAALRDPVDVALLVRDGQANYLAAAWRRQALTAALERAGDPRGVAMRTLVAGVTVAEVADPGWGDDCDTWADVTRARARDRDGSR